LTTFCLLDYLLVDGLDVGADPVPVATERVLREAALVLRRELIAHLGLHLVQSGAVGRDLLDGGDEIDEVAAEEGEVTLGPHLPVPGDDAVEGELVEGRQRHGPLSG
jgi:hypothetical protein